MFSHVLGQAVLGGQPFPALWALKLRSPVGRHVILQVGCRRARLLTNVALVSATRRPQSEI